MIICFVHALKAFEEDINENKKENNQDFTVM